mmetsp:Transcript_70869/g.114240  ORF Transcript_70869/g.114240 Transcript_70869/m.114240 type:complete len:375 (-) Transcript_70869:313-1437(-)
MRPALAPGGGAVLGGAAVRQASRPTHMATRRASLKHGTTLRCTLVGGLAALGVRHLCSTPAFLSGTSTSSPSAQPRRLATRMHVTLEDVIDAPTKLQKEVKATVEKTLDSMQRDDGRVLDTSSAAGSVGAVAVSLAVLPYIPLSLYSSYLLLTTGTGLEPGPNGIYGLAEGCGTLAIWAMVAWSLTSLVTRARGLPDGPLNLLGVTQGLCVFAAAALIGASALTGGSNLNPMSERKAPADYQNPLDEVSRSFTKEVGVIGKSSDSFFGDFTKNMDSQLEATKQKVADQASKLASEASSSVSKVASSAQDAAKEKADSLVAKASSAQDAAKEKADSLVTKAKDTSSSSTEKVKEPTFDAAAKTKSSAPDYEDLLS